MSIYLIFESQILKEVFWICHPLTVFKSPFANLDQTFAKKYSFLMSLFAYVCVLCPAPFCPGPFVCALMSGFDNYILTCMAHDFAEFSAVFLFFVSDCVKQAWKRYIFIKNNVLKKLIISYRQYTESYRHIKLLINSQRNTVFWIDIRHLFLVYLYSGNQIKVATKLYRVLLNAKWI